MSGQAVGTAHLFGDGIDTDALAPGRYMAAPIEELAVHCLETIAPEFAASVRQNDIVIAGRNFAIGSSREQAAQALKFLGVAAVVAASFGGIFYRNALNLGLPVFRHPGATDLAQSGDRVSLDIDTGVFTNVTNPRSAVVRRNQYARTHVGRGASIGANATIVCGHDIGDFAFIGAGAVVTKDVPAYALVVGNPARQDGWMSAFGHRLAFDADGMATCPESGDRYSLRDGRVHPIDTTP